MKKLFIYPILLLLANLSLAQYTITGVSNACDTEPTETYAVDYSISDGVSDGVVSTVDGSFSMPVGAGTYTITPILSDEYISNILSVEVTFPNESKIYNAEFCVSRKHKILEFEDAQFKKVLLTTPRAADKDGKSLWLDLNDDSEIDEYEASRVVSLEFRYKDYQLKSIVDCKHFPNLKSFYYYQQGYTVGLDYSLKDVDFTKNPHLEFLSVMGSFSSIDLSQNKKLKRLWIRGLTMTTLDLSSLEVLEELETDNNLLLESLFLPIAPNTSLTKLYVKENPKLKEMDVMNCKSLFNVDIQLSSIEKLEFDSPNLTYLNLFSNKISTLDVSDFPNLLHLDFRENNITQIDLSTNTKLTNLRCDSNKLQNLDVSTLNDLEKLWCNSNQIKSLNLSNNGKLSNFNCENNLLESLEFSSNNKNLKYFNCSHNALTTLDMSFSTSLTELICSDNPVKSIVLKNGVNDKNVGFNFRNTLQLESICVDWEDEEIKKVNEALRVANHEDVLVTSFCTSNLSNPDFTFSNQIITVSPNPVQDQLSVSNMDLINVTFEIFNLQGQKVKDGEGSTSIDVSELSKGIYLLKIKSDSGVYSSKFVKE